MVLFGSKLKIQIPSPNPPTPSPRSPIEFGFKNKDSHLALLSPAQRALRGAASAKLVVANLVVSDLELSEDYTCVISHGPNPKTTHIFDNCIIESRCCGCANEGDLAGSGGGGLLSSCHACNKRLGQGDEIFMYRGEKAFCSSECRHQEMLLDEAMD
uniref:FLZ-type domain-containing protein n=1 Tax=Ananas comosus var. bracteatus TaxID=296719 RepID=A0A6V7NMF4_ANACO|nr:unnamed protein product [Ananas comosus var. bracteatus]